MKATKFASQTVVAMSAAALFSVSAATIASASNDDPSFDAKATIAQTTFSSSLAPGSSYTMLLSVVDNLTSATGDGSSQCAVVGKSPDAKLITTCLTTLRLPAGEITINDLSPADGSTIHKGTILGATGTLKTLTGDITIVYPDPTTIEFKVPNPSTPPEPTTPTEPGTTPAEPVTTPAEPGTTPAEPGTTPAEPGTTPAEPGATPAQPGITPAEPVTTPAEPVTTPAEPVTTPAEPVTTPAEPVTTPAEPATAPVEPGTMPAEVPAASPVNEPAASAETPAVTSPANH